jgi:hypothetical protein
MRGGQLGPSPVSSGKRICELAPFGSLGIQTHSLCQVALSAKTTYDRAATPITNPARTVCAVCRSAVTLGLT